ncbi:MAG TPA: HD domain-containing protein [Longimicrobiales bacterium]
MTRGDVVARTEARVRELLGGDASGHDWWHIERVRRLALRLGADEGADAWVVELAALLHDVDDWKISGDPEAAPRHAREWLASLGVDSAAGEHVAEIVGTLSFKGAGVLTPMRTLEGQVVQDADRLDALGAIGIARAFAYGGSCGRPLHDPEAAPVLHASFEQYRGAGGATLNHFYEKLLLLRDRMNTAAGRRLAQERHRYMETFVARFRAEWDGLE